MTVKIYTEFSIETCSTTTRVDLNKIINICLAS